jgi:polyhydroxyalkanoate synthase subunit PhaC
LPLFLEMLRSETAGEPQRRAAALTGLKAFQEMPRENPREPKPARFREGRARVRDHGGKGPPLIVVPSLINPPHILDLTPDTSLMAWLAAQGFHAHLLDWGSPGPDAREVDLTAHVEDILIPLIAQFDTPPVLVGYCLGGTLALAAACATRVAGLALIAAPWHFAGFAGARDDIASLWSSAKPSADAMGLVPMEVLQSGFWRLDPGRTVRKYESFATMDRDSAAGRLFVAMEDWANAGAPLPYATGVELFERFVTEDTPGRGEWIVAGKAVSPSALSCPAIEFVSRHDRIVPAATAANLPNRHDLGAGHVGMIVGSGARAQLWEPLAHWLSTLPNPR